MTFIDLFSLGFMQRAVKDLEPQAFPIPDTIEFHAIDPGTGKLELWIGTVRGVYNSAWTATVMALVINTFLSLAGFYVVKNAVDRDRQTGVGQILATTRLSKPLYTLGKAASNLAVLGRYVLPGHIFDAIRRTGPGSGGEIVIRRSDHGDKRAKRVWNGIGRGERRHPRRDRYKGPDNNRTSGIASDRRGRRCGALASIRAEFIRDRGGAADRWWETRLTGPNSDDFIDHLPSLRVTLANLEGQRAFQSHRARIVAGIGQLRETRLCQDRRHLRQGGGLSKRRCLF